MNKTARRRRTGAAGSLATTARTGDGSDDEISVYCDMASTTAEQATSATKALLIASSADSDQNLKAVNNCSKPALRQLKPQLAARQQTASQNYVPLFAQIASTNNITTSTKKKSTETLKYETIESHFINNGAIFFVVYNASAGHMCISTRQQSHAIYYTVKPLWYMSGTPALRHYYNNTINKRDKNFIPVEDTLGDNKYAADITRKKCDDIYRCSVEACPDDPKVLLEKYEYTVHIPSKTWGQLAHYRLLHYKIDRVTAYATMPTSKTTSVNVYVVRWQNESQWISELLPAEYLRTFTQHNYHHQMVLDFFEEGCVQDLRDFRSAATVSYAKQDTAAKSNTFDDFWIKCVHKFRGRCYWTDAGGKQSRAVQNLFVYKWVHWPQTIGWVSGDEFPNTDIKTLQTEEETDDMDPPGLDEYVQLIVYDKFAQPRDEFDPAIKVEDLSARTIKETRNPKRYTAYVPPTWRQLAEQHAAENKKVEILGVFKQMSIANVYLAKWPSYDHPTLVASLTLRKRHSRFMVDFFEKIVYAASMSVYKPESNKK